MAGVKRRMYSDSDISAFHKELDEISCPICMDHPHNAVLLLCSSFDKGCRSYMCDTSYRHSNCLDRYKNLKGTSRGSPSASRPSSINPQNSNTSSYVSLAVRNDLVEGSGNELQGRGRRNTQRGSTLEMRHSDSFVGRTEHEQLDGESLHESEVTMKCPMCRGCVVGWKVEEEARKYLNLKRRSCSQEMCSFTGNYQELRRHARRAHPTTRPSDVDPCRERAWRRLENERAYGDIVSAIHSAIPGSIVVGDYVIENGDRVSAERANAAREANSPYWTTFFMFQMIGSRNHVRERRTRQRTWTRQRRLAHPSTLWGENLLGLQDGTDNAGGDLSSNAREDMSPVPRRRRRTWSRSDVDRS